MKHELLNKYKSLFKDFNALSKEDIITNLEQLLIQMESLEEENKLLAITEKNRIILLKENINLKEEIGLLCTIKALMDNAKVYGYRDLFMKIKEGDALGIKLE